MYVQGIKTRIFKEKESILDFVRAYISVLRDGDILVITSKIVALSQGKTAPRELKEKLIYKNN